MSEEARNIQDRKPPSGIDIIYYRMETVEPLRLHVKSQVTREFIEHIQKTPSFYSYKENIEDLLLQDKFKTARQFYIDLDYKAFFYEIENKVSKQVYDFFRALVWFDEGEYQYGLDILDELIKENNFHHNIFSLKGHIYHALDDQVQAEINLIYALLCGFGHPDTFANYGLLLMSLKDPKAAKYALKQSLKRKPSNAKVAVILGAMMRHEIIYHLQRFDIAMEDKYKLNALGQLRVLNHATRKIWLNSYSMREGIYQLIKPFKAKSICVMGAGNCNNFDVNKLSKQYKKVVLCDYDKYALGYARRIQQLKDIKNVIFKFGQDITGVQDEMYLWSRDMPSDQEIQSVIRQAALHRWGVENEFDIVISDCMLQSFFAYCNAKLGSQHRMFNELIVRMILRHIQILYHSLKPGGKLVVVSEVLSSERNFAFSDVESDEFKRLIKGDLDNRDITLRFSNPYFVQQMVESNMKLFPELERAYTGRPWLWTYPGINYLVAPLILEKK